MRFGGWNISLCRLCLLKAAVKALASCKDIQWEYRGSARARVAQPAVYHLHVYKKGVREIYLGAGFFICYIHKNNFVVILHLT
jgi:uncharacterized membrane protein